MSTLRELLERTKSMARANEERRADRERIDEGARAAAREGWANLERLYGVSDAHHAVNYATRERVCDQLQDQLRAAQERLEQEALAQHFPSAVIEAERILDGAAESAKYK